MYKITPKFYKYSWGYFIFHITFFILFIIPCTDKGSNLEKANHFLPKSFSEDPK